MLTENQLALWRAIKAKDEVKSTEALENLASIDFFVNAGQSEGLIPCVSFIIAHNMNDLLELALGKEADLTVKDSKHGNTPLHWAAKTNNTVAISLLIKQGADKQALNKQNQTPFQLLQSNAPLEAKKLLCPIPSLQLLTSLRLGENPAGIPAHLAERQVAWLQQYQAYQLQYQDNQRQIEQVTKAMRSLSFLRPN